MKRIDWQLISKKGVNFENLWISLAAHGFIDCQRQKRKIFGPAYPTAYRQIDCHRDMPASDVAKFLKQTKRIEKKEPGSILKTYYDYQKILEETEKYLRRLSDIDFSQFDKKGLVDFFQDYSRRVGRTIWYGYNYYFHQYLGNELYDILKTKEQDINRQAELFEILTQAKKLSVVQQEQRKLLLMVKKIKEKKLKIESLAMTNLINDHLAEFSFMGFFYFRGKRWDFDQVKKRLIIKSQANFQVEIEKIRKLERQNNTWSSLAKKLKLSRKEIILVKTLKQMAYCTNLYDEVSNYVSAQSQNLLKEIAKRLKLKYFELIELDVLEIIRGLRFGLNDQLRGLIKERLQDSALISVDNKVMILSGITLKKYRAKYIIKEQISNKIREVKGQPASAGSAKGKVALVYGVGDLSKVKRGNIMVAKATVPSFLPAMERAAAIITETGGLLSHSAIVSRELKIPCVVGIDKLMQIFKDGDLVEVDANNAVVTILKRK